MFRLQGCPEDDTIFLVLNYCMSFGIYSYDRPVLAHWAVFVYLVLFPLTRETIANTAQIRHHAAQIFKSP